MKNILYIFLTAVCVVSCQDSFRINGNTSIGLFEGKTLYLKVYDGAHFISIDSCVVHHGVFSFKGARDSVEMGLIYYEEQNLMPVMLDATTIDVEMSDMSKKVSGSVMNDSLFRFIDEKMEMDRVLASIPSRLSQLVMDGEDIDEVQPMLAREAALQKEACDRYIVDFIKKNINNPIGAGVFMLVTIENVYPMLSPEIEEILTDAGSTFRRNGYVKKYIETAEENYHLLREGKSPIQM